MGYRAQIYKTSKKRLREASRMSKKSIRLKHKKLIDPEYQELPSCHDAVRKILKGVELYDFGEPGWGSEIEKFFSPVFPASVHRIYNDDGTLARLKREGFLFILEHLRAHLVKAKKKQAQALEDVLEGANAGDSHLFRTLLRLKNELSFRAEDWEKYPPYNLEDKNKVTDSWAIEYALFELARIYKSIDWQKDALVYRAG